ncbi:KH domain-containing protein [Pseudanabaena sp. Chao 1811]|uniref:KH domain-containing protein n=1 Tax=Pseudanabaena sp. Chao 1811 TaxID=2963092 RepID=UPI0022F4025E|nr:KH domain-containing protein [Pseudanabaena sp. Chao 1811]
MPDYNSLISFLLKPLLAHPDALRVDFESNSKSDRVWIRVAFDPEDRGRVFGKGGRTIQAVRTVVMTAAQEVGHSARFEVFDPTPNATSDDSQDSNSERRERQQVQVERPRINVEKPKRREIIN